ncbi:hypothetical protein DRO58_04055 [Candidatus Bathyarchaeota archaeon]|nr:MAG: hypothetical protein DRO58_04055 [Candidatus Bathyarchaeota archaeon]
MFEIIAEHNKKRYIISTDGVVLTLRVKRMFFTEQVGIFSLEEFASNAVFNDETREVRYKNFLFKISDWSRYNLLKNTVEEILRKREEEEKVKRDVRLLNSAIKPALFEILKLRLWYVMYVRYANDIHYVDATYYLPEDIIKVKDPIDAFELLKKLIFEKVSDFTRPLESISPERREEVLKVLKEAVFKQDSLLDSHDYNKISEIMDSVKAFIEKSIDKIVEQVSPHPSFSHRQKSFVEEKRETVKEVRKELPAEEAMEKVEHTEEDVEEPLDLMCCPYCGETKVIKKPDGSVICQRCHRRLR